MSQVAPTASGRLGARPHTRWPRWSTVIRVVVLLSFSVVFITPFFWLVITALKPVEELAASPIHWLPQTPRLGNFSDALTMIDYWKYTWHTLFLATMNATFVTGTSALVGFGFGRLKGWGKKPLFILMLSTIMLPPVVTIIPTYVMFARLGLVDTYWPWAIWGLASSPFYAFLFRQFFASIPLEMEDAAIIDGVTGLAPVSSLAARTRPWPWPWPRAMWTPTIIPRQTCFQPGWSSIRCRCWSCSSSLNAISCRVSSPRA